MGAPDGGRGRPHGGNPSRRGRADGAARRRARAGGGAPPTDRASRRRAAAARRNRLLVGVAAAVSGAVLLAWFPGSSLLDQHRALDAAAAQLAQLRRENHALERQAKQLRTPSSDARIAQQQYDLAPQGVQAYQVLPKSGSQGSPVLSTSPGGGATPSRRAQSGTPAGTGPPSGFFGRVLQTLEFWR